MQRANDLAFIYPEEPGEWVLTYDQPKDMRIPPTEVERWTEPQFLAGITKDARFNRNGSGKGRPEFNRLVFHFKLLLIFSPISFRTNLSASKIL